ncbi:MAG: Ig domain protein group 2 domain protein, partial [Anaeromyxobacteraceae bacterium]|nr:Ig domain protein group 2 domain protein [Anaeromyxobacteraceae bacterium]
MNRHSLIALAVAALFIAACGASSPAQSSEAAPAAGQTVVVATAPVETSVVPGTSVKFTAQVTGTADTSVRWSVDEADGGTIDAAGLYTAPAIEGTFHVTAEQGSQAAAAASPTTGASKKSAGKSVVHVSKGAQSVTVTVSPGTATIPAGGSMPFAAAV